MTALSDQHCKPCEGGVDPLDPERAKRLSTELDDAWSLIKESRAIQRDFDFKNFHETMAFVNAVAWIAHQEDHHPDLEVGYGNCQVTYSTHAIGGLSENDFICAAKVDRL